MAKPEERVYRMKLDEFHRYLDDKRRELEACYHEIEEIQFQFNDIFKRELAAWQDKFGFCLPRVMMQRKELPAEFAAQIDRAEQQERERLLAEIADLEREITEGRTRMDKLLAEAQTATETLREANPQINAREEEIKATIVRLQNEYTTAFEEIEALKSSAGWFTRASKINRLKKVQRTAKEQQARAMQQLRQVRQEWLTQVQQSGETQSKLRQDWQEMGVRVSQAQTRRDHLRANLDALAEQGGVQHVLEELKEAPAVPGELGEALQDLARRNQVRKNYEEGLRSVAEALGLTKGVGEGLQRFQRSVGTVLQEQRRYNLKEVQVPVSHFAAALNETWKDLRCKVQDEKYMGTHPLEFSQIVKRYIQERLTDANIQRLFEEMGEALNKATSTWK